ncbi:MAG: methyltransferase domain-containing protein [Streptosporangiales bacterium]|nr:methyltransferase domain-containing protein [Streptosporangiales bacterium]
MAELTKASSERDYLFERGTDEDERLRVQGEVIDPITKRAFVAAGLQPGWRVLDLGSGAGNVSLLAAELVGPRGSVVGIDADADTVARATAMAARRGMDNVEFRVGDVASLEGVEGGFDAVVGRLAMPLWEQVQDWVRETMRRAGVEVRMGHRLFASFRTAGLPDPEMNLESIVRGGPQAPTYGWANVVAGVLPLMEKYGVATREQGRPGHAERSTAGGAGCQRRRPDHRPVDRRLGDEAVDLNRSCRTHAVLRDHPGFLDDVLLGNHSGAGIDADLANYAEVTTLARGNRWTCSWFVDMVVGMRQDEIWDADAARGYDTPGAGMFATEVLGPTVDRLAELAGGGRVLEFAIGTGRVAVPLAQRGVPVTGIELSVPMVEQLRTKVDEAMVPVVVGDMASARAPGEYSLVYLVFNTIGNLLTQAEQVACFRNAARHLAAGGRFVIELGVPDLRKLPPGQQAVVFHSEAGYMGVDTYDVVRQHLVSHHFRFADGRQAELFRTPQRYVWPAELDLMAQLAGFELESRHADWAGAEFTAESGSHISVYRLP